MAILIRRMKHLAALLCVLPLTAVADALLDQAKQKLQTQDASAAYQMLLPLESSRAGEPDFDLLFGYAALAMNEPMRALLAFDRCLAVQPRQGDCRLGLARAQMALNEIQSAKAELETIQQSAPPEQVAEQVRQYLGILAVAGKTQSPHDFSAHLALYTGYDDNTNVAPSSSTVTLPGAPNVGIRFSTDEDGSPFGRGELGLAYRYAINPHWHLLTGLNLESTRNVSVDDGSYFDHADQMSAYVGGQAQFGAQRAGLMLQGQQYWLGDEKYRRIAGLIGQYSYLLSRSTQLSAFIQHADFSYLYAGNQGLQDIRSTNLGVSAVQSLWQGKALIFSGLYGGQDRKQESAAHANINSDFVGARAGVTLALPKNWQLQYRLLAEQRHYQNDYLLNLGPMAFQYDHRRKDRLFNQEIEFTKSLTSALTLSLSFTATDNHSNIDIRDYSRNLTSLGVRYDFF